MGNIKQIAFLIYDNRSGSTYLAALLAEIAGVGVTIESDFIARLIERRFAIRSEGDLEKLIRLLYSEKKFSDWKISKNRLRTALAILPIPVAMNAIFDTIFSLSFTDEAIEYMIFKGPRLSHHVQCLRRVFQSPKFIYIVRDPRAVVSSQFRTHARDDRPPMSSDPVRSAVRWRRTVRRMRAADGPDILQVRYEDLIAGKDKTMARICRFLETEELSPLTYSQREKAARYFDNIPEDQKHMHANVANGEPIGKRVDAWRSELSETDIHLIQTVALREMKQLGYSPIEVRQEARGWSRLAIRIVRARFTMAGYALRRYVKFLSNFNSLWERILAKYYEYM